MPPLPEHKPERPNGGATNALWWAYEHAPGVVDPLIRLGRRYVLPVVRGGVEIRRLTGATGPDARTAVVIAAGTSLTLDHLVECFFSGPTVIHALGRASLPRLPRRLDTMADACDLVVACVPRVWGGSFGRHFLRMPALIGAGLRAGPDLATTLAAASRTVRADARRVRDGGYDWVFASALTDFERFYDTLYLPFVGERFGALGRSRRRQELRREFRHGGGMIWVRHGGRPVAGSIVRIKGDALLVVAEAVEPSWLAGPRPGAQTALNLAACELAEQRGLTWIDLGGSLPSLRDGVLRNKRAWGAVFAPWRDSHRDILIRWGMPASPAVTSFLRAVAPVFTTSSGLAGLVADTAEGDAGAWRRLGAPGIAPLFVIGGAGGRPGRAAGCVALGAGVDAAAVNLAASANGAAL